jgi:hypothetical protein
MSTMSTRIPRRVRGILAAVVVCSVVLGTTACGSDTKTADSGNTATSAQPVSAPASSGLTAAKAELCFDAHIGNDNAIVGDDPGEASDVQAAVFDQAAKQGGVLELAIHADSREEEDYGPSGGGELYFFGSEDQAATAAQRLADEAPGDTVQTRGAVVVDWSHEVSVQQDALFSACLDGTGEPREFKPSADAVAANDAEQADTAARQADSDAVEKVRFAFTKAFNPCVSNAYGIDPNVTYAENGPTRAGVVRADPDLFKVSNGLDMSQDTVTTASFNDDDYWVFFRPQKALDAQKALAPFEAKGGKTYVDRTVLVAYGGKNTGAIDTAVKRCLGVAVDKLNAKGLNPTVVGLD